MSTIYWANSVSGSWTASDAWTGGVVPGADDTAVINATGSNSYTVGVNTPVTVAGLDLDAADATLNVSSTLTASTFELEAGKLLLSDGTIAGTVADTGGTLEINTNSDNVLSNVTWQGALDPTYKTPLTRHHSYGILTIDNSLTLTGAGGTGPGSATFTNNVIFNGLISLDNAVISAVNFSITNSPTLTFGAGLTLNAGDISSGGTVVNDGTVTASISGATFINDGTLTSSSIEATNFINNGTVNALSDYYPAMLTGSITNNGTIDVATGQGLLLTTYDPIAVGATSSINLDGGAVYFQTAQGDDMTTSQLLADFAGEHIAASGTHGFGIFGYGEYGGLAGGTLDNTGATLDIDAGSILGTLGPNALETIEGGTVIYNGSAPMDNSGWGGSLFESLTLQSNAPTLSLGYANFTEVDLVGPAALIINENDISNIIGGTLSGIGTLAVSNPYPGSYSTGGLVLSDVDITGVGNSGKVNISVSTDATLNVSQQAIDGFTIGLSGADMIIGDATGSTIDVTSNTVDSLLSGGTLGSGMVVNVASGATLNFDNSAGGTAANAGHIKVAAGGTLVIGSPSPILDNTGNITTNGGVVELAPAYIDNTGSILVANGTLILEGPLTVASLSAISHPGSQEVVGGTLDLGGGLVTPGADGVPMFALDNGVVNDGTIEIKQAQSVLWTGASSVNVAVINNGNIDTGAGQFYPATAINGAISGKGTISLGATGGTGGTLAIGSTVAAGQTLAFLGGSDLLQLANSTAYTGFSGTLSGFAVGDSIGFGSYPYGVSIYGAEFTGKLIFVQFTDGSSVELATSTALAGSLSVDSINGVSAITYVPDAASIHDWSFLGLGSHFGGEAQPGGHDIMAVLALAEHEPQDWFFSHS